MTPVPALLSLAAGSVLDAGPEGTLRAAADAGFPAAGLRMDPGGLTPGRARALRRLADDLGLAVLDVEVARLTPGREFDGHLRLAELAEILGARFLLTVSEHPDRRRTVAELDRLCTATRGGPTRVAVEFMCFTRIPTLADAVSLAPDEAVVLVDALHLARSGGTPADLDGPAANRIGYLQLCDAPKSAAGDPVLEARHRRQSPGTGGLPLAGLLEKAPAHVPISIEVQSDELAARLAPPARARTLLTDTNRLLASVAPRPEP